MKIAILNTYEQAGGAAKAAYRLFQGLRDDGHYAHYIVRTRDGVADPDIIQMSGFNRSMFYLDKLMQKYYIAQNRTPISNTAFTTTYAGVNTLLTDKLKEADIINFHWIEKYLSLQSIKQIIELGKPIVWTLHDEKPFTGGCHYTAGCNAFKEACSDCLQLKYDPYHLAQKTLAAKYELLKDANISIVTPSRWLAERARESRLFKDKRVEAIANGIDTAVYKPLDKAECKRDFGIKSSSIVLQFGAQDNREIRKGFSYLIDAMQHCFRNRAFKQLCDEGKIVILCVGEPSKEIEALPMQNKSTGYIDNDPDMVKLYNATDIFILPSLEDNLPNTMLESMACKTPVIGFDTGGIPEVVNAKNGRVVEKADSKKLAEAILELVFNEKVRTDCGNEGHKLVNSRYKLSDQAKNYLNFFDEILQNKTVRVKKNDVDFNAYFDPIAGYALRLEAKQNNHLFEKRVQSATDIQTDSELLESLDAMCEVELTKNPLKKIKAYKHMLKVYHQTKR